MLGPYSAGAFMIKIDIDSDVATKRYACLGGGRILIKATIHSHQRGHTHFVEVVPAREKKGAAARRCNGQGPVFIVAFGLVRCNNAVEVRRCLVARIYIVRNAIWQRNGAVFLHLNFNITGGIRAINRSALVTIHVQGIVFEVQDIFRGELAWGGLICAVSAIHIMIII